jgi:hypothetical protein
MNLKQRIVAGLCLCAYHRDGSDHRGVAQPRERCLEHAPAHRAVPSSVLNAGGLPAWPTVSVKGGTWFGLPVVGSALRPPAPFGRPVPPAAAAFLPVVRACATCQLPPSGARCLSDCQLGG